MDNTQKKQPMSSAEQKKKEAEETECNDWWIEERIQIERKQEKKSIVGVGMPNGKKDKMESIKRSLRCWKLLFSFSYLLTMPGKDAFPQVFSKWTSPMKGLRCTFLENCFLIFVYITTW